MDEVRVDKFLFAMRLYKTRSIASEACKKGRVKMNDQELKPARTFRIGDIFTVRKGSITFTYKILLLSEHRLGARLVPDYLQDMTTPDQLEALSLQQMIGPGGRDRGAGRPTKKDRREIMQFIEEDDYLDDIEDEE